VFGVFFSVLSRHSCDSFLCLVVFNPLVRPPSFSFIIPNTTPFCAYRVQPLCPAFLEMNLTFLTGPSFFPPIPMRFAVPSLPSRGDSPQVSSCDPFVGVPLWPGCTQKTLPHPSVRPVGKMPQLFTLGEFFSAETPSPTHRLFLGPNPFFFLFLTSLGSVPAHRVPCQFCQTPRTTTRVAPFFPADGESAVPSPFPMLGPPRLRLTDQGLYFTLLFFIFFFVPATLFSCPLTLPPRPLKPPLFFSVPLKGPSPVPTVVPSL